MTGRHSVAVLLLTFVLASCAGSSGSAQTAPPSNQGGVSSSSPGTPYTSAVFGVPLTVVVSSGLAPSPTDDSPGLLSWTASDNDNNRVRFLLPAEVYPPGSATAVAPPSDFRGYVEGLADGGATFTDQETTTVDGVSATLVTAKSSESLDGSLGCPTKGADQADGCFGLQPELTLRIAIMDVAGKPLLAWARTDGNAPDMAFLDAFEAMLATVDFK